MRQYPDRVPVTLPFLAYGAKLLGFSIKEFNTDPKKRVKSVLATYEMFHPDTVGSALVASALIVGSLGGEVEFPEDGAPYLKGRILEEKSDLVKLGTPDAERDERLPFYQEVCGRIVSEIKDCGVGGSIAAPWSVAMLIRGTEDLIYDTVDDPDFVHELMRFTTELVKGYGVALRETGVGIGFNDPSAGCSVVSPIIYRNFVKPYHEELVNFFKERNTGIGLHICGYTDPIMEDMVSLGVNSVSIDGPSSLKKLVEVSQKKVIIRGNVATELFLEGTKKQIEAAVKECIDIAAKDSGYILSSGCAIPLNTPIENIRYFMEAGRKYGRYG